MKHYTQPKVTIRDMEIESMFLIGSDPTINTNDESSDMWTKEIGNDGYGHSIW